MLAIRAARLFNGVAATRDPLVLIDGERIVDVDMTGAAEPPTGAQLVDLGDVTLLPGLVDAHLHLALDASADPVGHLASVDDETLADEMLAAARRALQAGITTVRDLGDRSYLALQVRDRVARDPLSGPDVIAAGPPLTTPSGHCWFLGGETQGVDAVREAVRDHAERGVDVIKVMATGGELTPGTRSHECQFETAELRAAVAEAHRLGLPITAHAHCGEGIARALAAGFDGIEHATFLTAEGVKGDPALIDALAAAQIPVSVTIGRYPGTEPPPRMAAILAQREPVVARMVQAGMRLLVTSDAGIAPHRPHAVLPFGVADAATAIAAAACGLGHRKGRVAAGYDADLLAVAGDPLAHVDALQRPVAVMHRGAWVLRARSNHSHA